MALQERLREIVAEQLEIKEEISPQERFENLGADSLDLVEMVMKIEDEFKIRISDEESEKINTLQKIIDFLASKGIK